MTDIMIPAIAEDDTLFPVEKLEAHRSGQLHMAISAFVFDGDRLLIQRRALSKYHCGGMWANTVCTHPHWGEAPLACAIRRLREEIGAEGLALAPTGVSEYRAEVTNGLIEHERVHMFRAEADRTRLKLALNPAEVAEIRWARAEELRAEIAATPERFTPWFRIYVARWPDFAFGGAVAV
ncbi:MAG: isopentenyl-diphosphate Delta-isomerase [Rubrimonas sp.]|uniref:isopentenyl-diphosphate Delta-isomerase n=1 Tax=Rubrimonas sp. TaxID=2036015 RepID=UPI002FDE2E67